MRDTLQQGKLAAQARRNGLQQFYVARGHSAEEAAQMVEQHMRGGRVGTQATIQRSEPVLAESGDSGRSAGVSTSTDGG